MDQQQNAVIDESFFHAAKKITNPSGVQNGSKVQFHFDPAFQTLNIHFVRIIRDGQVLDRLDPSKCKVIQQETGLERHLFNGELSVVLFLEDVRVGDTIEYACTTIGSNPIMQGHFASAFLTEWASPMDRQVYRLLWPATKTLKYNCHKVTVKPETHPFAGMYEFVWNMSHPTAATYEDQVPAWVDSSGWIQLSDFQSWRDVVKWALPLYQHGNAELPPDLRAKIAAWETMATPDEKVARALRFVQDEVRYLGIEIGPNSHQPNPPGLVFSRRFGDCKDKVNLFCSIMDQMGIKSDPVLVSSYLLRSIRNWTPSPYAFNHVVARVTLDGRYIWLDPTLSYQRGALTNIYFPDYGSGLVIASDTFNLIDIPTQKAGAPLTTTYDTYRLSSYTNPVYYEVRIVKDGADADDLRATLAQVSHEELQKSYLNYFARRHSKIKVLAPIDVQDNQENNEITILQKYLISDFWEMNETKNKWETTLEAWEIADSIVHPQTTLRTQPLLVSHPNHRRQFTTMNFPGPANFKPDTFHVDDKAVRFERRVAFSKGQLDSQLDVNDDFETLTNMVSAADSADYLADLRRIREKSFFPIQRPATTQTANAANIFANGNWEPNWLVVALGGVYFFALLPVMGLAYFFRPKMKTPPVIGDPELSGIGGWLIVLSILLVLRPFATVAFVANTSYAYSAQGWATLTTPGNALYHPGMAPLLIFELLSNLTFLACSILMLVLFFQKRFAFRHFFFAFLIFYCVVTLFDYAGAYGVDPVNHPMIKLIPQTVGLLLGTSIWASYLLNSRRVKFTFVR